MDVNIHHLEMLKDRYKKEMKQYREKKQTLKFARDHTKNSEERENIWNEMDKIDSYLDRGQETIDELNEQISMAKEYMNAQAIAEKDQTITRVIAVNAEKDQTITEKDQTITQVIAEREREMQALIQKLADSSHEHERMEQRKQQRIEDQCRIINKINMTTPSERPRQQLIQEFYSWDRIFPVLLQILETYEPKYMLPSCLKRMELSTRVDAGQSVLGPFCHAHFSTMPILNGKLDLRLLDTPRHPAAQIRAVLAKEQHEQCPVFLLLGVSGTGKSSSLIELAKEHYTLFIQCGSYPKPTLRASNDDVDYAFYTMSQQIASRIFANTSDPNEVAHAVILADVIIRWFFLYYLIEHMQENATPLLFLLYQLQFVQSSTFFVEARYQLLYFPITILWKWYAELLQLISAKLQALHQQAPKFLIGVDEAQTASSTNMRGAFHSVHWSQLEPIENSISSSSSSSSSLSTNVQKYSPTPRGLLGPVIQVLTRMNLPMVICGTTLGLNSMDEIRSDVGKRKQALMNVYATEFIRFPLRCLSEWIHISDCLSSDPERFQAFVTILQGRPRLVTRIVDLVSEMYLGLNEEMRQCARKCDILEAAMRKIVDIHTRRLEERLNQNRHSLQIKPLLFRMYVSATLRGGKARFLPTQASHQDIEWDLMQLGFLGIAEKKLGSSMDGHIRKLTHCVDHHYQVWTLKEPFVLNLIRSIFSMETNVDLLQTNLSHQMLNLMDEYGRKCSGRGFILEKMVGVEWCNQTWKHKLLSELPFLVQPVPVSQRTNLPQWLSQFKWLCTFVDTIEGFIDKPNATELDWMRGESDANSMFGKCLLPSNLMGPDLFMILPSIDGQDILFVQCGCKLFSDYVDSTIRIDQESKLDVARTYQHVSQDMFHRFNSGWRTKFGFSDKYIPYQLKISIALPFTANDERFPRMEIHGEKSLLIRLNINDVVHLFGHHSVAYAILQYACQIETKEITVSYV